MDASGASGDTPTITEKSAEFQSLVDKDLVMNVWRDGLWGSFRHIPLDTGRPLRLVCTDKF